MTGPFFDTRLVLKLIVEEALSPHMRRFVEKRKVAVPFSRLIELETENALQALRYRETISDGQLAQARRLVVSLVSEGRFVRISLSLDLIAQETMSLAPLVTAQTGCRTLDLMHVATAKLLTASEFVSTDKRQLQAAALCGLKGVDLDVASG
jgi:predicted nucleic acid-binding protein